MLACKNLRKKFGSFEALKGISFEIERGDILGFIGPNGAGKTTTIRILAGLSLPSGGRAMVGGKSVVDQPMATRALVGYMPDFFGVYDNTTVWEYLDFFTAAFHLPRKQRRRTIQDVIELTDLGRVTDVEVDALSRGMKQRVSLARALLHDPQVLLLDEPASGLDPRARIEIRALLGELCKMGKTILISSHILRELSEFVNKITIIEHGELLYCGAADDIMRGPDGGFRFELRVVTERDRAEELVRECPKVTDVAPMDENGVQGTYTGTHEEASELVELLVRNHLRVMSFVERRVDLEDVFMRVTKGVVE